MRTGLKPNRRGRSSSRELGDDFFSPDTAKGSKQFSISSQAAWPVILQAYTWDYATLLLLLVVTVICEGAAPFEKVFYTQNDQEYWKYSYPLHTKNTVPAWTVPVIATGGPLLVFAVAAFFSKPVRLELHNLILGLLTAVLVTSTVTNLVKLGVGRPRPNFVARCWPDGNLRFTDAGIPDCAPNAVNPGEGRKSFPSGHTAWSTSGLAFLSFWLTGKLHCYDGSGHPSRLVLSALPIGLAAWIGITRLQDFWHHWEDVAAGFALGVTFAYLSYRQHFPPLMSSRSGEAHVAAADAPGDAQRSYTDLESAALIDEL